MRPADVCAGCRELLADCACADVPDVQAILDEVTPVQRGPLTGGLVWPPEPPPGFLPPPAPRVRLVVVGRERCGQCGDDHGVYGYRAEPAETPPPAPRHPQGARERPPSNPTLSLIRAMDPIG